MKIERVIKEPNFWGFVKVSLPPTLTAKALGRGYGWDYNIYSSADVPWFGSGNPIAQISGLELTLFHPQYLEDMETLARQYEAATGFEVTIKYYQSPKDAPLR